MYGLLVWGYEPPHTYSKTVDELKTHTKRNTFPVSVVVRLLCLSLAGGLLCCCSLVLRSRTHCAAVLKHVFLKTEEETKRVVNSVVVKH